MNHRTFIWIMILAFHSSIVQARHQDQNPRQDAPKTDTQLESVFKFGKNNRSVKDKRFIIRNDTLVFQPSSFKLQKDACLNDLLQHLPGMHKKGKHLFWHDKKVEIQIDGITLFGGHASLKRIPLIAIEELLLYNCASDLAVSTQLQDQEDDYKLSARLRHEYRERYYATLTGTHKITQGYEADAFIMKLLRSTPFILLLNLNKGNITQQTEKNVYDGEYEDLRGKQQQGSLSCQHNWNNRRNDKPLNNKFFINSSLNHQEHENPHYVYAENYRDNNTRNASLTAVQQYRHALEPTLHNKLSWAIDTLTTFILESSVNLSKIQEEGATTELLADSLMSSPSFIGLDYELHCPNELHKTRIPLAGRNIQFSTKKICKTELYLKTAWSKVIKRNHFLELSGSVSLNLDKKEIWKYFDIKKIKSGEEKEILQRTALPQHSSNMNMNVLYKHWISSHILYEVHYQLSKEFSSEEQKHYTYADTRKISPTPQLYPDSNECFHHHANNLRHTIDATLIFNYRKFSFIPALKVNFGNEKARHERSYIDTTLYRTAPIWHPSLNIKWLISPYIQASLAYNYTTRHPLLLQIIPWIDNTDPIYRYRGNSKLRSNKTHEAGLQFICSFPHKQINIGSDLIFRHESKPVTQAYTYDPVSTTYSVIDENALHPAYEFCWHLNYQQYLSRHWDIESHIGYEMKNEDGFLTTSSASDKRIANRLRYAEFRISPSMTYHWNNGKYSVFVDCSFLRNEYKTFSSQYNPLRKIAYGISFQKDLGPLSLQAQLQDRIIKGFRNPRVNGHHLLGSAQASYSFWKNKGKITLLFNDIFNQSCPYDRDVSPNLHREKYQDKLQQYVSLSISYILNP